MPLSTYLTKTAFDLHEPLSPGNSSYNSQRFETESIASSSTPFPEGTYIEGPHLITKTDSGRLIKRRFYGKIEDGWIAFASVYLHEWFGFKYYEAIPPQSSSQKAPDWLADFYSLPNLAIPISYFCIGVALQLLRTPLIVYFISDLGASAAEVNILFTVLAVPWCFKFFFGFLSDLYPLGVEEQHRKPYLMIGWFVYFVSNMLLCIIATPSIAVTLFLVFVMTSGYILADVMTDALIVERSRFETVANRGTMQSTGYIIRFFGSTIGAFIGAMVYNKDNWAWHLPISTIFFFNGIFVLFFLLPIIPFLVEIRDEYSTPKTFKTLCVGLFETVQLRAVYQPMLFVYIFNAMQISNPSWMNFLIEGLEFESWMIGVLGVVGSLMTWAGIILFKKYFFTSSWRMIFLICSAVNVLVGLLQLVLVKGWNKYFGINDLFFALGDDGVFEFLIGIQFLPLCIMYLSLCPVGSEGTTYALLTTFSNLAGMIAFDISTLLANVWDTSSEALAGGDYRGVFNLTLLCIIVSPLPLILLPLIPKNRQTQHAMLQEQHRSWVCGVIFLILTFSSFIITFVESVYEIYEGNSGGVDTAYSQQYSQL